MAIILTPTVPPVVPGAEAITLSGLVDQVLQRLQQSAGAMPLIGGLTVGIDAAVTEFTVAGPVFSTGSGFIEGYMELGDEIVYVGNVDRATGLCTSVVRGQFGTVAIAHLAGSSVIDKPGFYRSDVKHSLNYAVQATYPDLFQIVTASAYAGRGGVYSLPAGTADVMAADWFGPNGDHVMLMMWEVVEGISGKELHVRDAPSYGTVRVKYRTRPGKLTGTGTYTSETGLPDWTAEVAVLGACSRLLTGVDAGRALGHSLEQRQMNADGQIGRFERSSKYFIALHSEALDRARTALIADHPARFHYTN